MTPEARKLVEDNHSLIYSFLLSRGLPIEDYYGVAAIGLCQAAETYDASRGAFSTYAYRSMLNAAGNETRRRRRWGREVGLDNPTTSDGSLTLGDMLAAPGDLMDMVESWDAAERILAAICQLTDRDAQIVRMRITGAAQVEIAVALGISQSYISRLMPKIRKEIAAL